MVVRYLVNVSSYKGVAGVQPSLLANKAQDGIALRQRAAVAQIEHRHLALGCGGLDGRPVLEFNARILLRLKQQTSAGQGKHDIHSASTILRDLMRCSIYLEIYFI